MAGNIAYATLWNVVNRADRNRNGRLEATDGYVAGSGAGQASPAVADTFHAIWRGEAALDGVRMSPADAEAAAGELAGGQDFLDGQTPAISVGARRAMDGVGGEVFDGRISRRELAVALQWGAIAIARDSISLSQEARDRFPRQRPATPQAPLQPQITTPVSPQPPADASHPLAIATAFKTQRQALLARWGGRNWDAGFKQQERPLIEQAVNQVFTTATGSLDDRKAALTQIYQHSGLSYDEFSRLARMLQAYASGNYVQPGPVR